MTVEGYNIAKSGRSANKDWMATIFKRIGSNGLGRDYDLKVSEVTLSPVRITEEIHYAANNGNMGYVRWSLEEEM